MKPSTLFWCATLVGACANVSAPTDQQTAQLAAARQLLAERPGDALDTVEAVLRTDPGLRAARLLAGECSLRLGRDDGKRGHLYLQDARHQFERGLAGLADQAEPEARLQLAQCLQELGEPAAASASALAAASGFALQKGLAARRQVAAAQLCAAENEYRLFASARQAELDAAAPGDRPLAPARETAHLALCAATNFQAARADFPAAASLGLARINQFLGQGDAVLAELERGLREAPDATALHDEYMRWLSGGGHHSAMVGAYARFVRENPSLPILRWHQGRACYTRAHSLRTAGNYQGAMAGFQEARDAFGQYLSMMPAHRDTTGQWLAACELSIANASAEMGDYDTAAARLFAAVGASPLTTSYEGDQPALWDDCGSHFLATAFRIHRGLADGGADALQRTYEFDQALLEHCPDRFGFAYNNAALTARDLGVQRANAGDDAAALQLWERAYQWYEKATRLMPDDARVSNDCGLMLVYHLHRDHGRARELFDRAITIGQAQLAALPAATPRAEREALEEAVGDALQNIAVLLRDEGRPFADYAPFCERAVGYFPGQQRAAAAMLRAASAPATSPQQGGAAEAMAKIADQVAAKAAAGDYDSALGLLDGIAKQCRDHAPFHLRRGELTLLLAKQAREQNRKGVDLFFQDAAAALKRAVDLDNEPAAPRQLLAEAQYEGGDLDAAVTTSSALLLHLQSGGGGKPAELAAAHTLRANAAARAYQQKKQAEQDDQELLTVARTSLRFLEQSGQLDGTLQQLWSATEQWAAAPAEAVNVWLRASQRAPEDLGALDNAVNTAAQHEQLPLVIEGLSRRTDAAGSWYLAKARFLLADVLRAKKDMAGAQATLDAAAADFAASMAKNEGYKDSCETWIAMCYGKKGNIAFWSDDLANAEKWLLDSARRRPDQLTADLGLAESTKLGILRIADKFYQAKKLAPVERIYRAAAAVAPNDVDLQNNSGLFARDHGDELLRAGKDAEARDMFEQSYKAYSRAVELDPANVNLRNDCALILIYYLDRDWDHAKELLDAAIKDGEQRLRDNPPEDRNEKELLETGVGDAYENLALWQLKHAKDPAAAKAAAQKSLEFYPGQRRPGARRHLQEAERQLKGK